MQLDKVKHVFDVCKGVKIKKIGVFSSFCYASDKGSVALQTKGFNVR
jgi:hypothetical protein